MSDNQQPKMFAKIVQFAFKPDASTALYVLNENGEIYRRNFVGNTIEWQRIQLPGETK